MRNKYPKQRIRPHCIWRVITQAKVNQLLLCQVSCQNTYFLIPKNEMTFSPKTNKRIHAELRTFGEKKQLIQ